MRDTALTGEQALTREQTARVEDPTESNPGPVDRAAAVARLGGDEELYAEVALMFRADAPKQLDELRQAIATGDTQWVQRTAHALKGATGYVGARLAGDAARALEAIGAAGTLAGAEQALAALTREIERVAAALAELPQMAAS